MSCCICRVIWDELTENYQSEKMAKVLQRNLRTPSDFDRLIDLSRSNSNHERQIYFIRAFLSEVQGVNKPDLYRLDFRLVDSDSKRLATFLLEKSNPESDSEIYTPSTDNTSSEEVLRLARFWLRRCTGPDHPNCPNETFDGPTPPSYPTRLIELPAYDDDGKPFDFLYKKLPERGRQNKQKGETVRLVITRGKPILPFQTERRNTSDSRLPTSPTIEKSPSNQPNDSASTLRNGAPRENPKDPKLPLEDEKERPRGQYVTLSHCWGKAKFTQLTKDTEDDFKEGIPLSSLPLTFRQAINFARRLSPSIRYIWIDSLCIKQDDPHDWNYESVQMYSVYRNSYCNISATAASDSSQGLYFARDPHHLWEDEINLNTEGIPRPLEERIPKRHLGLEPLIRRCKIQDASFWDRQVDDAPINRRAWVLQERLLAPRVLHFCKNQIAWECRHMDATESHPHGISPMELRAGTVGERKRLKALMPGDYRPKMREVEHTDAVHATYENWKSIVERYSTTSLTKSKDKLIALAGIAQLTSERMGDKLIYVAGLWEKHLASQLLWYVEPKYEDERFKYPQKRPDGKNSDGWRAPTFSWAAVDAPQGIKCAETVRDENLKIFVEHIHVEPTQPHVESTQTQVQPTQIKEQPTSENFRFGAIKSDCYIDLKCSLIAVKIEKTLGPPDEAILDDSDERTVRYNWKVPNKDEKPIISSLYLDSPRDDFEKIENSGKTFCIPAHEKPSGQLICLLVQQCEGAPERYRRIGVADVPAFWKGRTSISHAKAVEKTIRLV